MTFISWQLVGHLLWWWRAFIAQRVHRWVCKNNESRVEYHIGNIVERAFEAVGNGCTACQGIHCRCQRYERTNLQSLHHAKQCCSYEQFKVACRKRIYRENVRLPLIPYYNTEIAQDESKQRVEDMGFHRFDKFRYSVKHVCSEQDNNDIEMWSRVLL